MSWIVLVVLGIVVLNLVLTALVVVGILKLIRIARRRGHFERIVTRWYAWQTRPGRRRPRRLRSKA